MRDGVIRIKELRIRALRDALKDFWQEYDELMFERRAAAAEELLEDITICTQKIIRLKNELREGNENV